MRLLAEDTSNINFFFQENKTGKILSRFVEQRTIRIIKIQCAKTVSKMTLCILTLSKMTQQNNTDKNYTEHNDTQHFDTRQNDSA